MVPAGVETLNELTTFKAIGVHSVQGFYLYRPADAETIASLLKDDR